MIVIGKEKALESYWSWTKKALMNHYKSEILQAEKERRIQTHILVGEILDINDGASQCRRYT